MSTAPDYLAPTKRFLEPIERISEALFGLIMVLTFTTTIAVEGDPDEAVQTMLVGALGCNVAWGIIDAVFYLMGCMAEKGGRHMRLKALRNTTDAQEAHRLVAEGLPPALNAVLQPGEIESISQRLKQLPELPRRMYLRKEEYLGALAVFLWVFLTTFPVAVPFMFIDSIQPALRVSNGVGIALLFGLGYAYGKCIDRNPWSRAVLMVVVGVAMVALCNALGG